MASKKKRVVLLDAHAIIHRAYHALPDFTSGTGEPTGALYGLTSMLIKIAGELEPDYIFACYDLPEPTYRHAAYEDYKAHRAETDEALAAQIERSRDIFAALNIPIYEQSGYEADDVLGTIVEQLKGKRDIEIIIASGDMDTLQLVSGVRVRVYTLKKGIKDTIIYDEAGVKERFGFAPKYLPDYKGLRGDPSDNIPGVPGVGEKTATQLITAYKTINAIYKKLAKGADALSGAGISEKMGARLIEHEEDAEFSRELATIQRTVPIRFSLPKQEWRAGINQAAVRELFAQLSFRTLGNRIEALLGGTEEPEEAPAPQEDVDPDELAETAIALWLVDSNIVNPTLNDILQFARAETFTQARATIFERLRIDGLERLFEDIERPLIPIVRRMEERGILIDTEHLATLSKAYHAELAGIAKRIYTHAGHEFNINSPKQLGEVLFNELGLGGRSGKRTGSGQRSTRESELAKLADAHPIINEVLHYRELQKLLSTYIDTIPEMVAEDGRLHAHFQQAGTTTGRMSSANPNLQNIPIRTDLGRAIRGAFVAAPGFSLAAFDYSQIELRLAAFLSNDAKLSDVFKHGGDVHTAVAAEVFGVSPEDVDYEMRRKAKVINFGILYGMGVTSLQRSLSTSRSEAQSFLNTYFERFEGLARYIDETKKVATEQGFTETYFGRRRYIEGIRSSVPYIKAAAERMAVNAPLQGTQADIIKLAMVRIDGLMRERGWSDGAHLLLQVHDELIYEVRRERLDEVCALIKETMESIVDVRELRGIPLVVDAHTGVRWGEMEKMEEGDETSS